jgi:hypothetical protein
MPQAWGFLLGFYYWLMVKIVYNLYMGIWVMHSLIQCIGAAGGFFRQLFYKNINVNEPFIWVKTLIYIKPKLGLRLWFET